MKISCQSCGAKYTIADEKVVGKVIKIKCKKCSATIVANGNDPAALAQMQSDDQAPTQMVSQGYGPPPSPDEWTVSVADDDQRTMTTAQILSEYAKGGLNADTYVWKDGMGDWLPITQVAELSSLLSASQAPSPQAPAAMAAPFGAAAAAPFGDASAAYGAPPVSYGAAAAPYADPGASALSGPASSANPPFGEAPAAARRATGRGAVDLFQQRSEPHGRADSVPPANKSHLGERNENSVLFSLKDLHAAESAAASSPPRRSGAPPASQDRVEDLFSMGSMGMAAPMLAPPPMNAPYVEPPPPPPSIAPMSNHSMSAPAYPAPPEKKSSTPVVLGIVGAVGVLALAAAIFLFVSTGGDSSTAASASAAAAATPTATEEPLAATATATASATAAPTETAEAVASASASSSADSASASALADASPTKDDPKVAPRAGDGGTTTKTETKKEEPKVETPKEEPKATAGGAGGTAPFDKGSAMAALGSAAGSAKGCKKPDGPTGSAKVQVTFAPSGKATAVSVGAPFGGTSVGSCIAGAFRGLSVPPFSGAPVSVSKTVNIR